MKLNKAKWLKDVKSVEAEIRAKKAVIRTPGYFASYRDWADLYNLKNSATCLYMVRCEAKGSGKLHMTKVVDYVGKSDGTTEKVVTEFFRADQLHTFEAFRDQYMLADEPEPVAVPA